MSQIKKIFLYLLLIIFLLLVIFLAYKFTLGSKTLTPTIHKDVPTSKDTLKAEVPKIVKDAPVNETIIREKLPVDAQPLEWSNTVGPMNWTKADAYCKNPANGYTRLPTKGELRNGLRGQFWQSPLIESGFTEDVKYWSIDSFFEDVFFYGHFHSGSSVSDFDDKSSEYSVRCVRVINTPTPDNKKLSVPMEEETQPLEWSNTAGPMNWTKADAYCKNPANGYTRLPKLEELLKAFSEQLLEGGMKGTGRFVGEDTEIHSYWSLMELDENSAFNVGIDFGEVGYRNDYKKLEYLVRCVR